MTPEIGPVVILAAMPIEAAPLIELLEAAEAIETPQADLPAVRGVLDARPVVVVTTGVGLVAASVAASWAALTLNPRAIISAGTAGGLPDRKSVV